MAVQTTGRSACCENTMTGLRCGEASRTGESTTRGTKLFLEAHGEWICFLGADDEFLPGAIGRYMALAAENLQAEYLSSK